MPVLRFIGYLPKEKAAMQFRVQARTINNWIKKQAAPPKDFIFITVDGYDAVKDRTKSIVAPPGVSLHNLLWIHNFSDKNKIPIERLYEDILKDLLTGIVLGDRIFIDSNEPLTHTYLAAFKRKRKKRVPYYLQHPITQVFTKPQQT
jgi:hypothetical protein